MYEAVVVTQFFDVTLKYEYLIEAKAPGDVYELARKRYQESLIAKLCPSVFVQNVFTSDITDYFN